MKKPLLCWGVVGAFAAAACNDAAAPRDAAGSIEVSLAADTLRAGDTLRLSALAQTDAGHSIPGGDITWATSDPSVATVSATGFVTTHAAGQVTIYAAIDALADSARLLVIDPFKAVQVTSGEQFSCAITSDGSGYCWGSNFSGALGNGLAHGSFSRPSPIAGGFTWTSVSAGEQHGCGIATGGSAYCWGYNGNGQLGDSSTISRVTPTSVLSASPILKIAPGDSHTCGLTATGGVCWGGSFFLNGFTGLSLDAITSGWSHECGLTAAGVAYCWGVNYNGQLGDGTLDIHAVPNPVSGGLVFDAIDAGARFSCGVTTSGAPYCWGDNGSGQLGDGTTTDRPIPTAVSGGHQFAAISSGSGHTCALTAQGAAWCWGGNFNGQLGDGTNVDRAVPTLVSGGVAFSAIAAGGAHTCGIAVGGVVYCWGYNGSGQLGDNTITDRSIPEEVWAP